MSLDEFCGDFKGDHVGPDLRFSMGPDTVHDGVRRAVYFKVAELTELINRIVEPATVLRALDPAKDINRGSAGIAEDSATASPPLVWTIPLKEPPRSQVAVWVPWTVMRSNDAWVTNGIPRPVLNGRPKSIRLLTQDLNRDLRSLRVRAAIGVEMLSQFNALGGEIKDTNVQRALGKRR
jgi:hypothetical protein